MKNILGAALFVLLVHHTALAQYNPEKVNKKAVQQYELAMNKASEEGLEEAMKHLENALRIDPKYVDAHLSLAGIHGEFKQYEKAVAAYEKARSLDATYFMEYNLPYSINLAGKGDFEKALKAVETFLTISNLNETSRKAGEYRKKNYSFAIAYQEKHPGEQYLFSPVNMGAGINSKDAEYFPSLTVDRKQLVFTRRINNYNEDFYESELLENKWGPAKGLTGAINTNLNEGAQNISQDGQMLVFTGCNFEIGFGSCDLYYSIRTKTGWSEPMNMGRNINTEFWESQPCLSPDKTLLYFASRRPDGFGGSDIYVSKRMPNGQWSEPENLGPGINTIGDESCPFLHADNETMYFMSNGHQGYGGDDLFLSRRKPDGSWGAPENLGYPINTIENEGSLFIASDGKTAYYASDRSDSYGALDLYSFQLRENIRPAATTWIKGQVFDVKTSTGLPSMVELTDLASGRVVSRLQTDEEGNYLSTLPVGKNFAFSVNRKGYLFYSENFAISGNNPDSAYTRNIPLQPFEKNAKLVLNNIFFDVNKYELKPESRVELNKLVALLKENPGMKIRINGHTDNTGNKADNQKLSENRARVIYLYLTDQFVAKERLSYKGFGDTEPIAENDTEAGRARNRRTEMEIIEVAEK